MVDDLDFSSAIIYTDILNWIGSSHFSLVMTCGEIWFKTDVAFSKPLIPSPSPSSATDYTAQPITNASVFRSSGLLCF